MDRGFSLFPESASTLAGEVDALYIALIVLSALFTILIAGALVFLSIRYRRGSGRARGSKSAPAILEIFWAGIPLLIVLGFFGWGTKVFFHIATPPEDGMQFYVTGKQWMWKLQHPTGQREINELHVPAGETVILTMTSEDVIHSFFVPAFRVKADVVPGMYSKLWFEATKPGTYHLFCTEYCGTKHSEMIGSVIVMDSADYQAWLQGQPAGADPVESGRILFENLRCQSCHAAGSGQRGPDLANRFGTEVTTTDQGRILFDEDYVKESILEPARRISAGYQPLMPTYQGQVSEEQILHLIAYIKSLEQVPPEAEEQP